jgi:hypothetical protein
MFIVVLAFLQRAHTGYKGELPVFTAIVLVLVLLDVPAGRAGISPIKSLTHTVRESGCLAKTIIVALWRARSWACDLRV